MWAFAVLAISVQGLVSAAEKPVQLSGTLTFVHAPPPLLEENRDRDVFLLVDGDFGGQSTQLGPFTGTGLALTKVYAAQEFTSDGIAVGDFAGVFCWKTSEGDIRGRFTGTDYLSDQYPPPIFDTTIQLVITGGTGRYAGAKGSAQAIGFDDPYGLSERFGNPFELGGVFAIFDGTLTLGPDKGQR